MNNFAFTYNQESAAKAGGMDLNGGAYACTITAANYVTANTGSLGLELSVKADSGQEFNYLTMYYQKSQQNGGEPIKSGTNCINAILYFLGLPGITSQQVGQGFVAPELIGKRIGLFLQKRLYTKSDGSDGYGFDIRAPFNPDTKHTAKEAMDNSAPQTIDGWVSSYADQDDRNQNQAQGHAPQNAFPDSGNGDNYQF